MNKLEFQQSNMDNLMSILDMFHEECRKCGTVSHIMLNVDYLDREGIRVEYTPQQLRISRQQVVTADMEVQRQIDAKVAAAKSVAAKEHERELERELAKQSAADEANKITELAKVVCKCPDQMVTKQALATKFRCSIKRVTDSDPYVLHETTYCSSDDEPRRGRPAKKVVYSTNEYFAWYRNKSKSDLYKACVLIDRPPVGYIDITKLVSKLADKTVREKLTGSESSTRLDLMKQASELSWTSRVRNKVLADMQTDPTLVIYTTGTRIFVPENIMA